MDGTAARNDRPESGRRVLCWLLKIIIILSFLVLAALLAGFVHQQIAGRLDASNFPPPGQMVDVGGHRLHLLRLGRGSPAIVFDSPLGASHLAWSLVQPRIAAFTETCAYDRAGSGWSEPGPGPRTSSCAVDELRTLLANSGLKPPYVLVGNSIGGLNVRLFAFRYPREVAALVLVDPAHEDQFARLGPSAHPDPSFTRMVSFSRLASRFGLLRLLDMPLGEGSSPQLPVKLRPMARAAGFRSAWVDALYQEITATEASFVEVRSARRRMRGHPLGGIPLAVLTCGEPESAPPAERKAWQVWKEIHLEIARESSRGEHEIVAGSGHIIQADQPAAVIEAIRRVWEAAAAGRPGDPVAGQDARR